MSWGSGGLVPTPFCPHPLQASPSLPPSPSSQQQQTKLKAPSGAPEGLSQPGPSTGDLLKQPAGCDIHFAGLIGCRFNVTCLLYFFRKTAPKPRLFIFCACAPRGFFLTVAAAHGSAEVTRSVLNRAVGRAIERPSPLSPRAFAAVICCPCHHIFVFGLGENTSKGREQATYKQTTP